ncbi:hypothetical protein LCGC14_0846180 [marine sediment metagenome]|uniref:Uncharacterized protein n=1 Tax=marine sediment metagenome TaxID=412755 RepID=A0A0F9RWD8_9ZZZZ
MSRQFTRDFLIEVQKGNVAGHSIVHKFGRNPDVPNGTFEGVNQLSALFNFLTAATTVRIKAGGNAADDVAGNGARTVTVEGLDNTGAAATETINTNGVNASSNTSTSFWRVFRAYVATCGTYGASNTAEIIIENSGGGTDLISIAIAEGQSKYGAYAIPLGKTGYLLDVLVEADAAKAADFRVCTREDLTDASSAPFSPVRVILYFDGVLGQATIDPHSPIFSLPALTDIWIDAEGGGAGTEVSCDFEILLVDD